MCVGGFFYLLILFYNSQAVKYDANDNLQGYSGLESEIFFYQIVMEESVDSFHYFQKIVFGDYIIRSGDEIRRDSSGYAKGHTERISEDTGAVASEDKKKHQAKINCRDFYESFETFHGF